ncbi:MAG: aspartate--ammonia ligase [Clostridia bacterium]|nr:aspartate--ammonia ligase [Clostridia bacterium]
MKKLIIPEGYKPALDTFETQRAIKIVKDTFEKVLSAALNLERVTAPVLVRAESGINDDLSGIERKVHFTMKDIDGEAEIVQSLAKWKRMALLRYDFRVGKGLYTDMSAVRRDDDADNLHSIYVDQWDWEKIITRDERTVDYLKTTVTSIVRAVCATHLSVKASYPQLTHTTCETPFFITSQELEDMYPDMTGKQRENAITKEKRTVFIMQIGDKLRSGKPHDKRAPDYDDWSLNGDLLMWSDVLNCAIELSSMGIRVDEKALASQLAKAGCEDRMRFEYHKMVANGTLPLTIGGGIGQSRLCMLMLEKAHVGEVQASIWPEQMEKECKENNIILL